MADPRPICKFGASCYRKNPDHLKQFQHPADAPDTTVQPAQPAPQPGNAQAAAQAAAHQAAPAATPTPAAAPPSTTPAATPATTAPPTTAPATATAAAPPKPVKSPSLSAAPSADNSPPQQPPTKKQNTGATSTASSADSADKKRHLPPFLAASAKKQFLMMHLEGGEVIGAPVVFVASNFDDFAAKLLRSAQNGTTPHFPTLYDDDGKVRPASSFVSNESFVQALCEESKGSVQVHIQEVELVVL